MLWSVTTTHTHTHTHTHTCSDLQPWTYTSEISRMNMDFLCMCVKFNYLPWTTYPLPCLSPSLDISFYMHAYAICYRMAGLWQSWTSTVGVCPRLYGNFTEIVHGWKCLQMHTHTHTHTHTQTLFLLLKFIPFLPSTYTFFGIITKFLLIPVI